MLEIWGRRSSSNVQALMWCVGELGLEYVRHDAGETFGITDTDGFAALNPNRTIPVLRDGEEPPVYETGAILRYLAGCYGAGSFWPPTAKRRVAVDKWAEWAKINVAMNFTVPVFWRVVRAPQDQRDPTATATALGRLNAKLAIAEQQLSAHEWLAGPHFTLADIQFGHILFRYFDIEIERPDWPSLQRYHARLLKRPAYAEHVAIPYDDLRNVPLAL